MVDLEITASEIARRIGTTKFTISRHIKGSRRNPDIQRRIARILRVSRDEIGTPLSKKG